MARWDPGAEDRLRRAAVALFGERGYDDVSVAEIAEAAGLTRRTFFRYFTDKREVLFAGADGLPAAVAAAVRQQDPELVPLDVALRALRAVGMQVVGWVDPEHSAARRAVIDSSPDLQERERTKLAASTLALAEALVERGTTADTAHLLARVAMAVLETAFARWAAGTAFPAAFDGAVDEITRQVSRV